jgi:antitoxin HigA-1
MHPGRVLREEFMRPLQLDTGGLARALDIAPARIAPLIADKEPVTSDIALRLARCFRTRPEFWLSLQNAYDLSRAEAEFGAEIDARVQPISA